jgi:NADH dehydrogenase [ubiquinone] 1 alpha subcomplex assembly factor 1
MNTVLPRFIFGPYNPSVVLSLAMNTHAFADKTVFDFSTATNPATWQIVNDDVMGGVSRSNFHLTNGVAVFHGEVSLENNGGFASVRSLPARYDLAGGDAFLIRVCGDGRYYKFTARTTRSFDSAVYQVVCKPKEGKWEELCLPFKEFVPTFRGRVLSGEPPLDPEKITSVGFLISDKRSGAFHLEVAWIKAVKLPHSQ